MNDIFLSYSRIDRSKVEVIASALQERGWEVWWDVSIRAGEFWDEAIENALNEASCVVVVWSKNSIKSRWVRNEANEGARRQILVPVVLDPDIQSPMGFRHIQHVNLNTWDGARNHQDFKLLVDSIASVLRQSASERPFVVDQGKVTQPISHTMGIQSEAISTKAGSNESPKVAHSEVEPSLDRQPIEKAVQHKDESKPQETAVPRSEDRTAQTESSSRKAHNLRFVVVFAAGIASVTSVLLTYQMRVTPNQQKPEKNITREAQKETVLPEIQKPAVPLNLLPQAANNLDIKSFPHELILEATLLTWVVLQVDGGHPQEVLLRPGDKAQWRARDQFLVTLGNAGGVRAILNGKSQKPFGPDGKVVREVLLKP